MAILYFDDTTAYTKKYYEKDIVAIQNKYSNINPMLYPCDSYAIIIEALQYIADKGYGKDNFLKDITNMRPLFVEYSQEAVLIGYLVGSNEISVVDYDRKEV